MRVASVLYKSLAQAMVPTIACLQTEKLDWANTARSPPPQKVVGARFLSTAVSGFGKVKEARSGPQVLINYRAYNCVVHRLVASRWQVGSVVVQKEG